MRFRRKLLNINMVTQAQVGALIEAQSTDDRERFKSIALQIVADAERKEQHGWAKEIKRFVNGTKTLQPLPLNSSDVIGQIIPKQTLSEIFLHDQARVEVDGLLSEWKSRAKLRQRGLDVRRRVIFTGPPGTGKTVTGGAIATALDIPFFLIRIDGVIDSFLGKTASNLRKVFDMVKSTEGIYLFDEFDAIAKSRTDESATDVKEMRRVVNSLLQFLEEDGLGIIIATTNMNEVVDPAIWRRFELKLKFDMPSQDQVISISKRIFETARIQVSKSWNWHTYVSYLPEMCHAEAETVARTVARKVVLEDLSEATLEMVSPIVSNVRKPSP